jgi:hypothetical protein
MIKHGEDVMTAPGVVASRSALWDGEKFKIPQFG